MCRLKLLQVRSSWNLAVISYVSCLPQTREKSWWHHHNLVSITSSSFYDSCHLKIQTSTIFIGSSSKFDSRVDFGMISNFNPNKWIKRQVLMKEGIIALIWSLNFVLHVNWKLLLKSSVFWQKLSHALANTGAKRQHIRQFLCCILESLNSNFACGNRCIHVILLPVGSEQSLLMIIKWI